MLYERDTNYNFFSQLDAKFKSVCYGKYGCFSNEPPFDRFMVLLPEPPNVVGTVFRLFTRENKLTSQILNDSDLDRLSNSNYDARRRTIVLIHGYVGEPSTGGLIIVVGQSLESTRRHVASHDL